jgi:hypothetical protein
MLQEILKKETADFVKWILMLADCKCMIEVLKKRIPAPALIPFID